MNIINNEVYNINPRLDYTSLDDEYGIINVGSDITESVFSFAKKTKKDV